MRSWILLIAINILCYVSAQCQNTGRDHYLVEFDEFAPPTKDMIASFEGYPSIPFLAPDIKGTENYLGTYKGKNVILCFRNLDCNDCKSQIYALNLLQSKHRGKLQVISLADDTKASLLEFIKTTPVDFSISYNTKTLAEGPYAGELGYPRMFFIDEYGIFKKVLPQEAFDQGLDTYSVLEETLKGLK